MNKLLIGTTVVLVSMLSVTGGVSAAPEVIVPIDGIAGGEPGTTVPVGSTTVEPEFQDVECIATVVIRNGESTHPNNDIVITSGGSTVVVPDVESSSFDETEYQLPITLGETVTVSVRLGGDGFFSGGLDVLFDCSQNIPDSSAVPTTEPTEPTDPGPDTTDPEPAPTDPVTETTTPGRVIPDGPTTTEPGSGTPDPGEVLPATGAEASTAVVAFALVALGSGILLLARRAPRPS